MKVKVLPNIYNTHMLRAANVVPNLWPCVFALNRTERMGSFPNTSPGRFMSCELRAKAGYMRSRKSCLKADIICSQVFDSVCLWIHYESNLLDEAIVYETRKSKRKRIGWIRLEDEKVGGRGGRYESKLLCCFECIYYVHYESMFVSLKPSLQR